uniref:YggT family protein n=1 Tax=Thaumasiovibrio occultus TaxID=1891184 RepID=UPI000B35E46B|nr:YggT family protein [Thaumasiovibrio occultus]
MNSVNFLIQLGFQLFNLYIMVVILRVWLQYVRADFYNPFSQFVVKATQPIVSPLRRLIPSVGSLDLSTLLFAYLLVCLKLYLFSLVFSAGFGFILIAGLLNLVKVAGTLLIYVLIARAILSWISQGRSPIEYTLHQLTAPITEPLRRVIPPIGMLDLSVLLLFFGIQFGYWFISDLIPAPLVNAWLI